MTVRDFCKICEENDLLDYTMVTVDCDDYKTVDLEFGANIITFKNIKEMSISDFWNV